jgi:hypothetical protein
VAEVLRLHVYTTAMFGKALFTLMWETSPAARSTALDDLGLIGARQHHNVMAVERGPDCSLTPREQIRIGDGGVTSRRRCGGDPSRLRAASN